MVARGRPDNLPYIEPQEASLQKAVEISIPRVENKKGRRTLREQKQREGTLNLKKDEREEFEVRES